MFFVIVRIYYGNFICKYNERNIYDPIIKGNRIISTSFMNSSISVAILQREYGIVNTETQKKIIYSYAAGPCIILCMHDISSQRAILGHIDTLTIDPLNKFRTFLPENCDVYIVGGDNSTKSLINTILKQLKSRNYKIKFADPTFVAKEICREINKKNFLIYTPKKWRWIMFVIRNLPDFIFNRLNI